jgi:hypothetical protein
MRPTVHCTKHGGEFEKIYTETDNDGTQTLIKQYWRSKCCGFEVEIVMGLPNADKTN